MNTLTTRISAGNDENSSLTSLVVNTSDLLIKILLCLPVEFLLIVKPVSKLWYSLISDSYFMRKHCVLHNNKLSVVSGLYFLCHAPTNEQNIPTYRTLLLEKAKISTNVVNFPIQVNEQPGGGLHIQQSCNGLLLCRRPGPHTGTRYIYNPSTRHYRMIPPPPPFQTEDMDLSSYCQWQFYLAFSPHKSINYEVVFLWRTGYDMTDYKHQMAVYSSKTGSWRLCGNVELDCVFEMEIDYSGWKPICRVDLDGLAYQYGNVEVSRYRILIVGHVQGDGDEDELKALILLPGKIISHDLRTKGFKEICDCRQLVQYPTPAYIRSLANV
ncbi:F-box protein At5g07610-like [Papaver somniferum]|uniref:F-box protein At5g07610-like n=1 Tax=Papaver somniferum TaxID=3469 RepID=UPI000E705FD3|nr:F-box protein At5g07610-like [Papaver somniferum]